MSSLSCNSNYIVHFWLISLLVVDVKFECSLKTLWRHVSWPKISLYLVSTRILRHKPWQVQQSSLNKTNSFLKTIKIYIYKSITVYSFWGVLTAKKAESSQTGSTCYSTEIDKLFFSDSPSSKHKCMRQACEIRWTLSSSIWRAQYRNCLRAAICMQFHRASRDSSSQSSRKQ